MNTPIAFIACPNHKLINEGWGKLQFMDDGSIYCTLCKKTYSIEEIKQLITRDYHESIMHLQRNYQQNLFDLQKMTEWTSRVNP